MVMLTFEVHWRTAHREPDSDLTLVIHTTITPPTLMELILIYTTVNVITFRPIVLKTYIITY